MSSVLPAYTLLPIFEKFIYILAALFERPLPVRRLYDLLSYRLRWASSKAYDTRASPMIIDTRLMSNEGTMSFAAFRVGFIYRLYCRRRCASAERRDYY